MKYSGKHNGVILAFALVTLGGCTTNKAIRTPVIDSPTVEQARETLETNKQVRWGGTIVGVENKQDYTIIEIVDRPLTRFGVPKVTQKTGGRFLAVSRQFIEPENLNNGRAITISGQISEHQQGKIDQYDYVYPVVEVAEFKIWPNPDNQRYYGRGPYPYWSGGIFWGPSIFIHHRHFRHRLHHRRHW